MTTKSKQSSFTFLFPKEFDETFKAFEKLAGEGERSVGALIRSMIKEYVEAHDKS